MKVNKIDNRQSFKGAMNNKVVLKGLEYIADHGATFVAATSAAMAIGVRPLSVALAPKTDKKNKQYMATNSIASGLVKFAVAEAVALPVENAIKKIDKNPEKFLNEKTISTLKEPAKKLIDSKNYRILTQGIKQSTGFISAIPKSMLTIALIPVLMDKIFTDKKEKSDIKKNIVKTPEIFDDMKEYSSPSFKGGESSILTKGISKVINDKTLQNAITKHNFNEANVVKNVSIATDLLVTGSFVHSTMKSKKIEKERKKPLIYENLISMGTFLACGCAADKFIQKHTKNFMEKFKQVNKNDVNLAKYVDGLNIFRSTMTFAVLYYAFLPIASTFCADKIDKFVNKKEAKKL